MRLNRIATLAAVLLTVGACSRMPMGPTAYSALPADPTAAVTVPVAPPRADVAAIQPEADVALTPVVIPGTWTLRGTETLRGSVNPAAVLDASVRSRMAWKALRPEDLLERSILAARSVRSLATDIVETSATTRGKAPAAGRPLLSADAPATYDREATMSALLRGGQNAAKSICSGC